MNAKHPIALLMVAALAATVSAGSRQAAPRAGGGHAPRASAPSRPGGSAARSAPRQGGTAARSAPRQGGAVARRMPSGGVVAARGTARGVARYGYGGYGSFGYGYGYGYYPYYPYYGYWGSWWYPWWGVGWYGGCWDCYWPAYGDAYASYQMESGGYGAPAEGPTRSDPAVIETKVSPSSAAVSVDGEEFGFAGDYDGRWDRLRVSPGVHAVAFREKGHRTLTVSIDAQPGATYVLKDSLAKGEGDDSRTVATVAPPEARTEQAPPAALGSPGRDRAAPCPRRAAGRGGLSGRRVSRPGGGALAYSRRARGLEPEPIDSKRRAPGFPRP